ncbi:MAG: hypothetical protein ACI9SQ_000255 [Rubritalea sp.]|jgi:hypothetical protein
MNVKAIKWLQLSQGLKTASYQNDEILAISLTEFDDDLKEDFRSCFSAICYGDNLAGKNRGNYTYSKTIREFNKRLSGASANTQLGMIGELIIHLIVRKIWPDYTTIIPYFNLEDRNIKKGFDSVIYSISNGIWATEVKSGYEDRVDKLDEKINSLLRIANTDISKKLDDQDEVGRLWGLAMNGFHVACNKVKDEKEIIENIIFEHQDIDVDSSGGAVAHNVILSSVAFCKSANDISIEIGTERHLDFKNKYSKLFLILAKKKTTDLLIDFLIEEEKK